MALPRPRTTGSGPTRKPAWTAIRTRRLVQGFVVLLTLAIGLQFVFFARSCVDPASPAVERPPGVAGFLPIAGLMGLRNWLATGRLDHVQPSAALLLLLAILVSIALKKSFCSWICPVGTASEWMWRLRARLFKRWPSHAAARWLDRFLMAPKYVVLGFFGYFILVAMTPSDLAAFIEGPYNRVADVRMLAFFAHPSSVTITVLAALVLFTFLVKNAWCRYLCPYGALLGLASFLSPVKLTRLDSACTGCAACTRACPMHLPVRELGTVRSPECTACLLCVDACPEDCALAVGPTRAWDRGRTALAACLLVLLVYFGGILLAKVTGHWANGITRQEYRQIVPGAMQRYPARGNPGQP